MSCQDLYRTISSLSRYILKSSRIASSFREESPKMTFLLTYPGAKSAPLLPLINTISVELGPTEILKFYPRWGWHISSLSNLSNPKLSVYTASLSLFYTMIYMYPSELLHSRYLFIKGAPYSAISITCNPSVVLSSLATKAAFRKSSFCKESDSSEN